MRLILARERRPCLIIAPLGVRREFLEEARRRFHGPFAVDLRFVRTTAEVDGPGIYLTNYESVREGKIDCSGFVAVSLDEAAILRGFGGTKTFREFMAVLAGDDRRDRSQTVVSDGIKYRFVATATPSPNEHLELLSYSGFLGVLDIGAAKTRFFKRNSEKADNLTLLPHKAQEFWLWVASWALFITKPSDICEHPCHRNGKKSSARGTDGSPSNDGPPAVGSVGATAAESGSPRPIGCGPVGMPAADAPASGTAGAGRQSINLGAPCASAAATPETRTGPTMEGAASESAIDGRTASLHPSPTWALDQTATRLSGTTTTGDTSPETAAGRLTSTSAKIAEAASSSPTGAANKPSPLGQGNSGLATGGFTPGTSSAGQPSAFSDDVCNCDDGYDLPPLDIRWHELPVDHLGGAGLEKSGQMRMFRDAALGLAEAAREKRDSLTARVAKLLELRAEDPAAHRLIWHDLEDERRAIEAAIPGVATVYGAQDLEDREATIGDFADGRVPELAAKPVMLGSGANLQWHCAWAVFLGLGYKFADFIQAVHRLRRFGQTRPVRIDLIYTEAEREVRRNLEHKWRQHEEMVDQMVELIREYGLTDAAMQQAVARAMGVERVEARGEGYRIVHNDCVVETAAMAEGSVDLIVSSIPFGTQYEYTNSFHDFGHTDDDTHFWRQMGFLIPELLRVLAPGRAAAIHVKDRIVPGGLNGFGFQTLSTFHCDAIRAFCEAGFAYLGMKTIATDVVRENNQTYRLGWTEQCKDGSRMGCGVPEYLLIFRKPPSDLSNGYADKPVVKAKKEWDSRAKAWVNEDGYSRGRWQLDAHGLMRSSGDRLLASDLDGLDASAIYKVWKAHNLKAVYDFEHHVAIAERLETQGKLPPTFMLVPPHSAHPDIWSDVARMRTLNMNQSAHGRQMHCCPLQLDIVDRAIIQLSEPGETVYDPFGGIGTVPYCAIKLGRQAIGCELDPAYFLDACHYAAAATEARSVPTLFDLLEAGVADGAAPSMAAE
ncbi:MAG: DNA methyltransferase [Amaricoccus sp.]|uniref:DNA methyltransferase n=1 Tax=Amaricoccus sp. TaxID=1872485 RepID=UPI0039E594F7